MTALLGKTLLFAGCTAFGLLQEAGDVLGRYDGESQRQALEGLLRGLEGQAAEAAEMARRLCRVYLALGLAAGLFCLILL